MGNLKSSTQKTVIDWWNSAVGSSATKGQKNCSGTTIIDGPDGDVRNLLYHDPRTERLSSKLIVGVISITALVLVIFPEVPTLLWISLASLAYLMHRIMMPHVGFGVSPMLRDTVVRHYTTLKTLRQDKPAVFCVIVSTVLIITALFGCIFKGRALLLFLFAIFLVLNAKYRYTFTITLNTPTATEDDQHDELAQSLVPEPSDDDVNLLQNVAKNVDISTTVEPAVPQDVDESSINTILMQDKLKRYTNNLLDNSPNSSSEENLSELPIDTAITAISGGQPSLAKSSGGSTPGSPQQPMVFKNEYFNNSSSASSDDDETSGLTRGLNFAAYTDGIDGANKMSIDNNKSQINMAVPATAAETTNITSSSSMVPSLVTTVMSWGLENVKNKLTDIANSGSGSTNISSVTPKLAGDHQFINTDDSDESDFEMLDKDELMTHSAT